MCPPLLALIPAAFAAVGGATATAAGAAGIGAGAAAGASAAAVSSSGLALTAGNIALVSSAISAAGATASFIGQQQQARAAKQAANENFSAKVGAVNSQALQLSQEASEDSVTGSIKMAQDFGRIAASASTLGLGKSTLAPFLGDTLAGDARDVGVAQLNIRGRRAALGDDLYGAQLARQSAIAGTPAPSPYSLALNIGKSGLDAGSLYGQVGGKFNTGQ